MSYREVHQRPYAQAEVKTLCATSESALDTKLNEYLMKGWVIFGPVILGQGNDYVQQVVRYSIPQWSGPR